MRFGRFRCTFLCSAIAMLYAIVLTTCGSLEPEDENQPPEITLKGNPADTIGIGIFIKIQVQRQPILKTGTFHPK